MWPREVGLMRRVSFGWLLLSALVVIAPVIAACGGDDDSGGGGSAPTRRTSRGLCKSVTDFSDAMDAALAGPTPADSW